MKPFQLYSILLLGTCFFAPTFAQVCTKEYQPVCAKKSHVCCTESGQQANRELCSKVRVDCSGVEQTYSNACLAQADGAIVLSNQTCIVASPTVCTTDYTPVCVSVQVDCIQAPCPSILETYSNRCSAEAAGSRVTILYDGACVIGSGVVLHPQDYVTRAYSVGLTKYPDINTFRYDAHLLREESARMFVSFADLVHPDAMKQDLPDDFANILDKELDDSLSEFVSKAFMYRIFNLSTIKIDIPQFASLKSYKNRAARFYPKATLTRGQALAMLMRVADDRQDESRDPWYHNYAVRAATLLWLDASQLDRLDESITRGELTEWMYAVEGKIKS